MGMCTKRTPAVVGASTTTEAGTKSTIQRQNNRPSRIFSRDNQTQWDPARDPNRPRLERPTQPHRRIQPLVQFPKHLKPVGSRRTLLAARRPAPLPRICHQKRLRAWTIRRKLDNAASSGRSNSSEAVVAGSGLGDDAPPCAARERTPQQH